VYSTFADRKPQTSKASVESQAQGASLFIVITGTASSRKGCPEEVGAQFAEVQRRQRVERWAIKYIDTGR